ncbi:beta-1,3-galactosyltransferase 5, partial [Trichonephila inaurata madagascariensis]
INPQWHLDFLINPTRLCDTLNLPDSEAYKTDPEVKLLVLVPSAINHFDERKTIRKTWGSMANHSLATAHSIAPDEMELLWDQMTKHLFDFFDFPDSMSSLSDSSEFLDGKSLFDLFNLPKDSKYSHTDSSTFSNIAEKLNSPQLKAEARNWQTNEISKEVGRKKGGTNQ